MNTLAPLLVYEIIFMAEVPSQHFPVLKRNCGETHFEINLQGKKF